ncbi:MAG: YkoP family protein [Stellaceae bacterium]
MAWGTASSDDSPISDAFAASSATWPDELWVGSVSWCDAILRACYGVHEFTDDPACVFRIGLSKTRAPLALSDGTLIDAGELVGTLHFWNEHLPRYTCDGPNLGWARAMRDQVANSLCTLASYVESDCAWRRVQAFRAEAALTSRRSSRLHRVIQRYGFEQVASDRSLLRRAHDFGDDFLLWGLTRAFNPAALPRLPFLRDHRELWISRALLLRNYRPPQPRSAGPAARPCEA